MNDIEKAIVYCQDEVSKFPNNFKDFDDSDRNRYKILQTILSVLEAQQADTWIPVASGKYPDINKDVQVTFREFAEWSNKYLYGICKAIYISEHSIKTEDMGWYDCESVEVYDEEEDVYYVEGGWYEVIENWSDYTHVYINREVIAWKPLDEPWKED